MLWGEHLWSLFLSYITFNLIYGSEHGETLEVKDALNVTIALGWESHFDFKMLISPVKCRRQKQTTYSGDTICINCSYPLFEIFYFEVQTFEGKRDFFSFSSKVACVPGIRMSKNRHWTKTMDFNERNKSSLFSFIFSSNLVHPDSSYR